MLIHSNSNLHIPIFSETLSNEVMKTNADIRRENLLIALARVGSAGRLSEMSGVSEAYISQIKTQQVDSKTKKPRKMGNNSAIKIELALGEPPGWMDQDHSQPEEAADRHAAAILEVISKLSNEDKARIRGIVEGYVLDIVHKRTAEKDKELSNFQLRHGSQ